MPVESMAKPEAAMLAAIMFAVTAVATVAGSWRPPCSRIDGRELQPGVEEGADRVGDPGLNQHAPVLGQARLLAIADLVRRQERVARDPLAEVENGAIILGGLAGEAVQPGEARHIEPVEQENSRSSRLMTSIVVSSGPWRDRPAGPAAEAAGAGVARLAGLVFAPLPALRSRAFLVTPFSDRQGRSAGRGQRPPSAHAAASSSDSGAPLPPDRDGSVLR